MIQTLPRKLASIFFVFCFVSVQLQWAPIVNAEMVSTSSVLEVQQLNYDKSSLKAIMQKDEAKAVLQKLGVSSTDIEARIAQLTPEELTQLNKQAELQPAGSSIVGIVIFVVVALAITDLVGLTDVYPFIDSIN